MKRNYYLISMRRGKSNKDSSVMGCLRLPTNDKSIATDLAKRLDERDADAPGGTKMSMVLTERQAQELYEQLGRRLAHE